MYRSRFVLVKSLMLLGLALVAFATMIPSYVAVQSAPKSESVDVSPEANEQRDAAFALEYAQGLVKEFKPSLTATSSPLDVVISALGMKPQGVLINRIMYAAGEEEDRITFVGSASRERVSAYRDALTQSGLFTGVAVPVGALVGSEGGGFSIVMVGNF